jgi:hypothetical protein
MIDEVEATKIAEALLAIESSGGCTYRFLEAKSDPDESGKWLVLFSAFTREGHEIDGFTMVLVDKQTGNSRLLPAL